jgi:hypothetical protein
MFLPGLYDGFEQHRVGISPRQPGFEELMCLEDLRPRIRFAIRPRGLGGPPPVAADTARAAHHGRRRTYRSVAPQRAGQLMLENDVTTRIVVVSLQKRWRGHRTRATSPRSRDASQSSDRQSRCPSSDRTEIALATSASPPSRAWCRKRASTQPRGAVRRAHAERPWLVRFRRSCSRATIRHYYRRRVSNLSTGTTHRG